VSGGDTIGETVLHAFIKENFLKILFQKPLGQKSWNLHYRCQHVFNIW
jgi:hypothetical protein